MTDAKVEVEIDKGVKAVPRSVSINGWKVPNVTEVLVSYGLRSDARRVTIEILATDVIEVDPIA